MANIEHSLCEDAEIKLGEDFPDGQYLEFQGSGALIKVYLEPENLQEICNELALWGYQPEEIKSK